MLREQGVLEAMMPLRRQSTGGWEFYRPRWEAVPGTGTVLTALQRAWWQEHQVTLCQLLHRWRLAAYFTP